MNWNKAYKDRQAGMSLSAIAKKYKIPAGTVKSYSSRHWKGLQPQPAQPPEDATATTATMQPQPPKPKKTGVGGNGNLIPLNQRPKEAQREIQSKGAHASNKAQREAKERRIRLHHLAEMLMDKERIDEVYQNLDGDIDIETMIDLALINKCQAGNIRALELYYKIRKRDPFVRSRVKEIDLKEREVVIKEAEHQALHGISEAVSAYRGIPASSIGKSYLDIDRDINARRHSKYDFKGGRGGGRSSYCSLKLIDQIMLNPAFCGLVVRAVKDTMRDSVYAQVVWAIEELGLDDMFRCTVSPMQIIRKDTGQVIYFRGADEPGKIKSIRPPKDMHIGMVWFEEADQIPGGAAFRSILQSAFRGGDIGLVFRSYNTPISKAHHINKEALKDDPARIFHHGYYYDMPPEWLGQKFLDDAEHLKATNERAYRHEYLGEATGSGENVFENVKLEALTDAFIATFDKCYFGLDWGFYPDPTAFNAYYYNAAKRTLYIYDEVRALKAGNKELAELLKKWQGERIIADSAEPKSIHDFQYLYGFSDMTGARKGAGSVDYGIKWLASLTAIVIDPVRCPGAANEFSSYEYARNKDGEIISGYPDKDNHHIDNARYATEEIARVERYSK